MQLGKAKALGMFDHHDGRVRHIDAHFDDGSGDEETGLAALEEPHRLVLLRRRHAAMHEPDPLAERFGQNRMALLRRHQIGDIGLLHQRADPVCLLALGGRRAQPFDDIAQALHGDDRRLDRLAASRLLGELGNVHVAESCEHERARDGRCRHHQHVR